jgi:hypothetical protein
MGGGRWTDDDWKGYSSSHIDTKSSVSGSRGIYSSSSLKKELDPKGVRIRESCDSADNPHSSAVIICLDVTGSMGSVLEVMARKGLPTVATEIYNRKPVSDPHIMCMGVGDVEYDDAPLQVTQFEADIRIAEQLTQLYLEMGGGGNDHESYILPWYFAAMHTKIDCFEKRGKKGIIFTIGDECPTPYITASAIEKFIGDKPQFDKITAEELLTMVSRQYEVFHIMVAEGSYYRSYGDKVKKEWTKLLGQRAIVLTDHTKLGEVIISTLQALAGEDINKIVDSWDGSTKMVVKDAIKDLTGLNVATDAVVKFD